MNGYVTLMHRRASIGFVTLVALFFGWGLALADESPPDANSDVEQAEAAFAAHKFQKAVAIAAHVADDAHDAARVRYIEGYAQYKLGNLEAAGHALDRALALTHAPEIVFLAGLVAFERRQWDDALLRLEPLTRVMDSFWARPAQQLIDRAKRARDHKRAGDAQARHTQSIRSAEQHIKRGEFKQAEADVADAESIIPEHALTHYYRGYLAYQRRDYAAAQSHFRRALVLEPDDPWASYMLALSLPPDNKQRHELLAGIAKRSADATLRRAAQRALIKPRKRSVRRLFLALELGSGLDTNPSYATASSTFLFQPFAGSLPPAELSQSDNTIDSALALRGQATLRYQRSISRKQHLSVGLRVLEQGYTTSGDDLAQTEVAGELAYMLTLNRLTLTSRYSYSFRLFGHDPLMSTHDLDLRGSFDMNWLRISSGVGLRWRDIHDVAYDYQQAIELAGFVSGAAQWRFFLLQVGFQLTRGWSDPAEMTLAQRFEPDGQTTATLYRTDNSLLATGPQFRLVLQLPWRLVFDVTGWALWYRFDHPDRFVSYPNGLTIWQQERRDLQFISIAELRRPFKLGKQFELEAALQVTNIDNLSSFDSDDPINRNYDRRLILGLIRLRWSH